MRHFERFATMYAASTDRQCSIIVNNDLRPALQYHETTASTYCPHVIPPARLFDVDEPANTLICVSSLSRKRFKTISVAALREAEVLLDFDWWDR